MRILLIDDDPVALTTLALLLKKNVGSCDTASSGINATECFVKAIGNNQPYDLITIDIELPDITGLDLLTRFSKLERKNGITPAKKIIVTAHSKPDYVIKSPGYMRRFLGQADQQSDAAGKN